MELSVKLIFDSETNDVVDLGTLEFQVVDKLPSSEIIIEWPTLKRAGLLCRCHSHSLTTNRNRSLDNVTSIPRIQYMKSGRVKEEDESSTDVESIDDPQDLMPQILC